jgi:8-oxo-dGTP diphosphatase
MNVRTEAIVVDQYGNVLVTKGGDSRTWAVPGGEVSLGELPPEAAVRQVEEQTGLKVAPVRLTGVYYEPQPPAEWLTFCFRCLVEGGQMIEPDESIQLGYATTSPLPRPMLSQPRRRLADSLTHAGGPPIWAIQPPTAWYRLVRDALGGMLAPFQGQPRLAEERQIEPAAGGWQVGAFVVLQNPDGEVLWALRRDRDAWNLPGGGSEAGEAPWQTAVRETFEESGLEVELTDLSGVYVKPMGGQIILTFTGQSLGGQLTIGAETAELAYFAPGAEPDNTLPLHPSRVADALTPHDTAVFRKQQKPPESG